MFKKYLLINSTYSWRYLNVAYGGDRWRLLTFPLNEHTLYCIIYWSFICSMPKCPSIPINGQVAGFIDINSSLTWSWLAFFMCGSEKAFVSDFHLFAYMFPTFGFIWRHHPWKMTGSISELSSFYRLLCTVTILKQQTKINPNVIQFKLW